MSFVKRLQRRCFRHFAALPVVSQDIGANSNFGVFEYFRFAFEHVTPSTDFRRQQVTSPAMDCKHERQINRLLRIGSNWVV